MDGEADPTTGPPHLQPVVAMGNRRQVVKVVICCAVVQELVPLD